MSQEPIPEDIEALRGALTGTRPAIVCYVTCWDCMSGKCHQPPAPHSWWDDEDIAHAKATGQAAPTGTCVCPCARVQGGAA